MQINGGNVQPSLSKRRSFEMLREKRETIGMALGLWNFYFPSSNLLLYLGKNQDSSNLNNAKAFWVLMLVDCRYFVFLTCCFELERALICEQRRLVHFGLAKSELKIW